MCDIQPKYTVDVGLGLTIGIYPLSVLGHFFGLKVDTKMCDQSVIPLILHVVVALSHAILLNAVSSPSVEAAIAAADALIKPESGRTSSTGRARTQAFAKIKMLNRISSH